MMSPDAREAADDRDPTEQEVRDQPVDDRLEGLLEPASPAMTTTPMWKRTEPTTRLIMPEITAKRKMAIVTPTPTAPAIPVPGIPIARNPRKPTIAERTALTISSDREVGDGVAEGPVADGAERLGGAQEETRDLFCRGEVML